MSRASDRSGLTAEQITRFRIRPDEIADLQAHPGDAPEAPTNHTRGEINMPKPRPITLRPDATREERIAALPAYPRSANVPVLNTRLTRLSETAFSVLSDLDDDLTDLADAFAERFDADDARAAARDRIAATAHCHRANTRH